MKRLARWALPAIILCGLAPSTWAADQYRLTDLGALSADPTSAITFVSAINSSGAIVGQSFDSSLRGRAFLWERGRMIDLGDFGPVGGEPPALSAFAINSRGAIVGTAVAANSAVAALPFQWLRGRMTQLGTLANSGATTFATSINDRGDVVGAGYRSPGDLRAIRWADTQATELGGLPDGRVAVQAFDINKRGEVVGYLSPGGIVAFTHGFLWRDGTFTDLGTLPGTNLSFANAINERTQIVGQALDTLLGTGRAFLWADGAMQDLSVADPSHLVSEARDINRRGTVVGTSGSGAEKTAWIWQEGGTQDLNALISAGDPNRAFVKLTAAVGINDKEEIVAQGTDVRLGTSIVRSYLLAPVNRGGSDDDDDDDDGDEDEEDEDDEDDGDDD